MSLPDWLIQTQPQPQLMAPRTEEIQQMLAELTEEGWEIIYCGHYGIQARRPHHCHPLTLILAAMPGLLALPLLLIGATLAALLFCLLGILVALLVWLDHLRRPADLYYRPLHSEG